MAQISIPGGGGSPLVFTVAGTVGAATASAAANYATDFATALFGKSPLVTDTLSSGQAESTVAGAENLIFSNTSASSFTLSTGGQFTYAAVTNPTTITGSTAGNDSVIAGGDVTYDAVGGSNNVVFTTGTNVYQGSSVGGDTVSGGLGYDTINTGNGATTVFSGEHDLINLNDSVPGDLAILELGNSTVNAFGVSDTVVASATGTIFGGAGALTFVSEAGSAPVSINGGTGTVNMFGTDGTSVVFSNQAGAGLAQYIAGSGNESLNGYNSDGGFAFFGNTDTTASINDTVVGGSGGDYFSTGAGNESIFAGSGAALFEINSVTGGANITISDFSAADSVNFEGMSVSDENALLSSSSSTVSGGNLTVSLSDGTKVEFVGITSLSGHVV